MNVPWDSGLLEQRMEIKRTQPFFSGDMLVFQKIPGLNEKAEISKKEKTVGIFFCTWFLWTYPKCQWVSAFLFRSHDRLGDGHLATRPSYALTRIRKHRRVTNCWHADFWLGIRWNNKMLFNILVMAMSITPSLQKQAIWGWYQQQPPQLRQRLKVHLDFDLSSAQNSNAAMMLWPWCPDRKSSNLAHLGFILFDPSNSGISQKDPIFF